MLILLTLAFEVISVIVIPANICSHTLGVYVCVVCVCARACVCVCVCVCVYV